MIPANPNVPDDVETGGELNHAEESIPLPLVSPEEPFMGNGNVPAPPEEDTEARYEELEKDEES